MSTKQHVRISPGRNALLKKILSIVATHEEIKTLWKIANVTAIHRLHMTDHGEVHSHIVAKNALTMTRLLVKRGVELSARTDYGLTNDQAEVIVYLTSILHDVGMSIHRTGHEEFSLFLVNNLLREMLTFLPTATRTIIISEVLHGIISHRSDGSPLTIEGGIVRVADALDMSEGRSRLPYQKGILNIHFVSALAIDTVVIRPGATRPIQIDITMNHTAGIFQVDELLKKKVMGSGVEQHLDISVYIDKGRGKQLFKDFFLK